MGTRFTHKARSLALAYPSPYHVGMSSLGFQTLYRLVNDQHSDWSAERAFLPEQPERVRELVTLESGRSLRDHDAIGISVAYELEVFGLIKLLQLGGMAPLAHDRTERDPLVLIGGPLTFSNPLPTALFADAVLLGECEVTLLDALSIIGSCGSKREALEQLSRLPSVLVPAIHGDVLPEVAAAPNELLPAHSVIRTPDTELSDMFLVEAERGCHRNCTFCVMRRSTNGGMRLVSQDKIFSLIPADARKVGLVGAAVSDHPKIVEILHGLVEQRGLSVGISSLRADRLNDEFVRLLAKGGYRTLTVASDAASQRLRSELEKNIKEKHLLAAAELARKHGLRTLKTYMMIGVPGETDADIDELIRFSSELSRVMPLAIGVAPFVPKYNTPLSDADFAGETVVTERMERLRLGLRGRAEVRTTSSKEAYVEALLATAGQDVAHQILASQTDGFGWKSFYKQNKREVSFARRRQHFVAPFAPRTRRLLHGGVSLSPNA